MLRPMSGLTDNSCCVLPALSGWEMHRNPTCQGFDWPSLLMRLQVVSQIRHAGLLCAQYPFEKLNQTLCNLQESEMHWQNCHMADPSTPKLHPQTLGRQTMPPPISLGQRRSCAWQSSPSFTPPGKQNAMVSSCCSIQLLHCRAKSVSAVGRAQALHCQCSLLILRCLHFPG